MSIGSVTTCFSSTPKSFISNTKFTELHNKGENCKTKKRGMRIVARKGAMQLYATVAQNSICRMYTACCLLSFLTWRSAAKT